MFWLLFSCSGKDQDTGWENCDEAPLVSYDNFGQGFLTHNCQACHASTAENRYGAPHSVVFDTQEDVTSWLPRIYATTIGETRSMPPAGVVEEDNRTMLYWWLICHEGVEQE